MVAYIRNMHRAFLILILLLTFIVEGQNSETLNEKAYQYFLNGNYEKAESTLNKALLSSQKDGNKKQEFYANIGLLNIAYKNYDYKLLYKHLSSAEKLLPFLGENETKIAISNSIIYNNAIGNYDEALRAAKSFHANLGKIESSDLISSHNNLGAIYLEIGDYALAQFHLEKAIELSKKIQDFKTTTCQKNLASTYIDAEPQKAINQYIQILKSTDDIYDQQDVSYELANIYLKQENLHLADSLHSIAYQLKPNRGADIYLLGKAKIEYLLGNYKSAISHLNKAENFLLSKDDSSNSIDHYKIQVELCKNFLALENYDKALSHLDKAFNYITADSQSNFYDLPEIEQVSSPIDFLDAVFLKAKIAENIALGIDDKEKAIDFYYYINNAIHTIRTRYQAENSKYLLANNIQKYYNKAINYCYKLYEETNHDKFVNHAFYFAENNKASMLLNALTDNNAIELGGLTKEEREKERDLKIKLAFYNQQYTKAKIANDTLKKLNIVSNLLKSQDEYLAFTSELEHKHPQYYRLKYQHKIANIDDIQSVLNEHKTLVEFVETDSIIYSFYVSKNHVAFNKTTLTPSLKTDFENFKKFHTSENVAKWESDPKNETLKFAKTAFSIYNNIFDHSIISKSKYLVIIPDGNLNNLPLGAIVTKNELEEPEISALSYLTKNHICSFANSATIYFEQKNANNSNNEVKIVAFAPSYNTDSTKKYYKEVYIPQRTDELLNLEGAIEEVVFLKENYNGLYFINDRATENFYKNLIGQADVLHLAMHGIMDDKNPKNSHLVFTLGKDTIEDNMLYPFEISNLPTKAQLVVLSACKTGAGKQQKGEGLLSISRSFSFAGAKSMLTTHWDIPDLQTPEIIKIFYSNLSNGDNKALALQKSQLNYINTQNAHPYYWAGFTLFGNTNPIAIKTKSGSNFHYYLIMGCFVIGILYFTIKKKV